MTISLSSSITVGSRYRGMRLIKNDWRNFLLRDDFITQWLNSLASPRTAEPGPGTLTITDTENKLSISGGELIFAGGLASPLFGNPGMRTGDSFARATGRAMLVRWRAPSGTPVTQIGFDDNTSGAIASNMWGTASGQLSARMGGAVPGLENYTAGTYYQIATILRTTGALYLVKGGVFTNWTLFAVDNASAESPLYPTLGNYNSDQRFDTLRVLDLPAPFDTDYGLATQRLAGSVAAGTTFTHEANCVIEWTQTTKPSSGPSVVVFRRQDATNYWYVYVASDGSLGLYEGVAGVETQRAVNSAGVSNGHRIVIVADGTTIRGYSNNVLRWTYSSASNFATATDGVLSGLGTGGAVSDICSFPRTLTGAAAAILDSAIA